ncbi:MAG: glycoside hydrolase family 3 N-terminal domain-containing protein [Anaerolineales bacterium]|nr:glycoside hydrolase family 3 N-terminal domain-containing protein [Anaerolineales bacterium]
MRLFSHLKLRKSSRFPKFGFYRFLLAFVFLIALMPAASAQAQTPTPSPEVQRVLNSMSPEERVGQLFLVTFTGTNTETDSQIYNLVSRYRVGGAVLLAQNDNFASESDTIVQTRALIENIQKLAWDTSASPVTDPATGKTVKYAYAPLFIGIAKEDNGYPTEQILNGLTPLPSDMAIGATWNVKLAAAVAEVRGRELSALGFNLYLGPSLDVLESPSVSGGDFDTRVFGGDPFWVGEMGRAYITGLHTGSDNRLLVVAKHFPGVGSADRLPEEEVSTVRKSLEQLKQIELAPFFAVTGGALSPESKVDGLLVSHIRYQGFQGNIRATTRPISFDPQALSQILALPQFSAWASQGGLIVSDNLGARAVREFYASGGGQFSARIAARDAFLAGNDMLYLGNIVSGDSSDTYSVTANIIEFFTQKYREDPAFAQRVDASAARILAAKMRLYGSFSLSNVTASKTPLFEIGTAGDITFDVARNAATLVSPDRQDLAAVIPLPPQQNESMVFITDTQSVKQCSTCAEQPALAVNALQQAVLRLYGPQSGNQTANFRLTSYSFQTLQELLDAQNPESIESDLTRANWVVISLSGALQSQPALVSRFLRERPNILRDKRVILFSFGAPYYFDTTTISKFTAYFALYSRQPQFVDVAARLLFQEITPIGASPVSIPGIGYDLISVMSPDPNQIIPLSLDLAPVPAMTESSITPEATAIPLFQIGDTIAIRAGVIKDHNGHSVPDGTVVRFSMLLTGEGGGILKQVDAVTTQGMARAAFGLDKPGLLEIHVTSEPALISESLQLDVSQSGAVAVTVVVPQLTQPAAPTPSPSITEEEDPYISKQGYPLFSAWIIAMLFIVFSAWITYGIAYRMAQKRSAIRLALGIALGGLVAYNFLAFGLLGVANWLASRSLSGVAIFIFFGEALGFAAGWVWAQRD